MRYLRIFLAISLIGLMIICCSGRKRSLRNVSFCEDSLSIALTSFKKDSSGCIGLRTKDLIGFIYSKAKIEGKRKDFVVELLGPPNNINTANGANNLIYFFKRSCLNGVPVDSIDRCSANLYIEQSTQRVISLKFICE